MRALVTGGAGFIGSHLVDALLERGDEVLVLDDLSTGKRENLAAALDHGATLESLDISDAGAVLPVVERFKPESVFHLAAQIDVRKSMADPGFDVRLNVLGTVNMLEAASRAETSRFVFTSTGGAIYGEGAERADELPFAEKAACEPLSVYGQSKMAAEGYVGLYRRSGGLEATSMRLGNVYGPRQDPALEAGVVAVFTNLALSGGQPTIFGDGKPTRDYVHVADVVAALLAAETKPMPGAYNVGTGIETNVLDLAETIWRIAERSDLEPEFAPARDGEVDRVALDPRKTKEQLGFSVERDLETGLEQTLAQAAG
jgi:UDP-glucose 4-epimerase